MKNLVGYLIMGLSMTSSLLAEDVSAPIDYSPYSKRHSAYSCRVSNALMQFCFDQGFSEDQQKILERALMQLHGSIILQRQKLEACMENTGPRGKTLLSTLRDFLSIPSELAKLPQEDLQKEENLIKFPLIMLSKFRELPKDSKFSDQLIFSYAGFFDASRLTEKAYVSIGVSRRIEQLDPIIGANTRLWAGLLTLGTLVNLGFAEDSSEIWKSPMHHLAQCVMFRGEIPATHQSSVFNSKVNL